jgi:hypothetical protein
VSRLRLAIERIVFAPSVNRPFPSLIYWVSLYRMRMFRTIRVVPKVSMSARPETRSAQRGIMQFAKRVYMVAGVTGCFLVLPAYFMEGLSATNKPAGS